MNKKFINGKFEFYDTVDKKDIEDDIKAEKEIFNKRSDVEKKEIIRNSDFCVKVRKAIFLYMKKIGLKVINEEVGNGYFVFDFGDNSVVHFKLDGFWLKDYQFGMWITADKFFQKDYDDMTEDEKAEYSKLSTEDKCRKYTVVEIFQQHGDYIDKFKPSRSAPVIELSKYDVEEILKRYDRGVDGDEDDRKDNRFFGFGYDIDDVNKLIRFMKKHPFLHFSNALGHGKYAITYSDLYDHPVYNFFKERIRFHITNTWKSFKIWYGRKSVIRICKSLAKEKCVKLVKMEDFEHYVMPNCTTDYMYEISILFSKESTLKECSHIFDKHIKSSNMFKVDWYQHVAKIEHINKECDYTDSNGKHHNIAKCIDWVGSNDEKKDIYERMYKWYNPEDKYLKKQITEEFLKKYPDFETFCWEKYKYDAKNRRYSRAFGVPNENESNYEIFDAEDTREKR